MDKNPATASLIADAISTAVEIGAKQARATWRPHFGIVRESEKLVEFVKQLDPEQPADLIAVDRPRNSVALELTTLKSLVDMLAAPHSCLAVAGIPIVQVMPDVVRADYNPDGHLARHSIEMPLAHAESYKALQKCMKGVLQPDFWKLLATDLNGCFPEVFEVQISQLGHTQKTATDVNIERSGIGTVNSVSSLKLHFNTPKGPQDAEIIIDWTYIGPLWTCFEMNIEIPCRLVISAERGLLFELVPRRLEALILQHRAALAQTLIDMLAARDSTIPVYEGNRIESEAD